VKKNLFLIAIISISLNSCFAPVNLTYESARTLKKGEIDVQGNYSRYYQPGIFNSTNNCNNNFGVKVGYGIKEWYTMKFRYERLVVKTDYDFGISELSEITDNWAVNYFELENKFKLLNNNIALGIPLGYYSMKSGNSADGLFSIDPRVYFTFSNKTNKFEFNLIPKLHIVITDGFVGALPGISLGFGFSSDLDKWALRPEFGYDGNFSFGFGLNIIVFKTIKKE